MELDTDTEYRDWLASIPSKIGYEPDASTLGNGLVPVWQLSASCGAAVGWRGVLQADLEEKARVLGLTRAWLNAPEDKFLLFSPSQIDCTGELYGYVHGHHRGCALHAMLAFYFRSGSGLELPRWLAEMAMGIPADIAHGFTTRLEVVSRGMARTLKMQHGTTKVSWVDIIVALRQLCGGAGASTPCEAQPDKLQEALREHVPAFYDKVADWARVKQVLERVAPESITALLQFNSRHGAGGFPQAWFRHSWALLEPPARQKSPKENDAISPAAQLLYVRRLLDRVGALATKRREELQDPQMAFQQVIKGVLQKKVFNEEHRKEISQLAQKYTVGMSMAAKRHGLKPDCLAAFSDRFVQGEFDKEIERTTQPAVVGPICSWVREFKLEELKKTEKNEQQALDVQAAAQVQAFQKLGGRASMPGGEDEADEVEKQSGKDAALRGAVLSVAKAHFHALKSLNVEVREEAEQACLLAEDSTKAARQHAADQHFSLLECIKKDETHELVMRNELYTQTAVPGVTWCDLNHVLPDDVLSGSQDFTKEHTRTLQNLLRSVATQRAVVVLCPSGSVAVRIETSVQDHILTCTDFTLSRVTVLFHEDERSQAYGSATLLFLSTNLLQQSGSELASCAQKLPQIISTVSPKQSTGTCADASTLRAEDKASRWAKHAISFYEDVFGGLGLPGGIQIAEVEAGGGEMLATIEHAKLHQSGKPWASWTWLGNVPAKATARLQHIKEAIGKFGEQLLEQNVIGACRSKNNTAVTTAIAIATIKITKSIPNDNHK